MDDCRQPEGNRLRHYQPSAYVRYAWVGGRVVILDLRSEAYVALDPTASFFWEQLLTPLSDDERVWNLCQRFKVDAGRLAADLDEMTRKCIEDGLLVEGVHAVDSMGGASSAGRPPARGLLTGRAWWSLMRISRSLRARGFAGTYQEAARAVVAAQPDGENHAVMLGKALCAFARAENFCYLKKAPQDCLPRSLALFHFLQGVGLRVVHCIGVRQFPFGAHAWVECQGQVVHDNPAVARIYTVIARLPHEPIPGQA